jgi:hypothetical protein
MYLGVLLDLYLLLNIFSRSSLALSRKNSLQLFAGAFPPLHGVPFSYLRSKSLKVNLSKQLELKTPSEGTSYKKVVYVFWFLIT